MKTLLLRMRVMKSGEMTHEYGRFINSDGWNRIGYLCEWIGRWCGTLWFAGELFLYLGLWKDIRKIPFMVWSD